MGILDKLFGGGQQPAPASQAENSTDEQAVARYRYMLKTAPPETIEEAHREAFEKLTPDQRRLALQRLSEAVPPEERPDSDDPRSLARTATRAEMRQPGVLGGAFGGGGMGMGGIIGGSLLGSLAGSFIGSSIAHSFFSNPAHEQGFAQDAGANDAQTEMTGNEVADATPAEPDPLGDPADSVDAGGFDSGYDSGGFDVDI